MRRYDESIEVRKGSPEAGEEQAPAQFLWRGRLWKVRGVVAHWVETGPWWQSPGAQAVVGSDDAVPVPGAGGGAAGGGVATDLLTEREVWLVEAVRGRAAALATRAGQADGDPGIGVFELVFDWAVGGWRLTGCLD